MLLVRLFLSTCLRRKHDAFVPMCYQLRSHHSIPNSCSSTSRSTTAPRGCLYSSSESGGNGHNITILKVPTLLSQGSPAVNGHSPVLRRPESRKTRWTIFVHGRDLQRFRCPPTTRGGGGDLSVVGHELIRSTNGVGRIECCCPHSADQYFADSTSGSSHRMPEICTRLPPVSLSFTGHLKRFIDIRTTVSTGVFRLPRSAATAFRGWVAVRIDLLIWRRVTRVCFIFALSPLRAQRWLGRGRARIRRGRVRPVCMIKLTSNTEI